MVPLCTLVVVDLYYVFSNKVCISGEVVACMFQTTLRPEDLLDWYSTCLCLVCFRPHLGQKTYLTGTLLSYV